MLLLSMITQSSLPTARHSSGSASASCPWRTRNQSDRLAPAARNRHVSARPRGFFSSVKTKECSVGAHPHGSPSREQMPWPYWVIFTADQSSDLSSRINPAITDVLPMFRECPPTTTVCILNRLLKGFEYKKARAPSQREEHSAGGAAPRSRTPANSATILDGSFGRRGPVGGKA